jgi:hypothetical protein
MNTINYRMRNASDLWMPSPRKRDDPLDTVFNGQVSRALYSMVDHFMAEAKIWNVGMAFREVQRRSRWSKYG